MGARQVLGGFSNSDLSSLFHMHKKMEMELQCPACLDLLNIPTLLPCDHICCKKCISYLMEDGYCTACRLPFNGREEELRVIYSIQNMVEQFNIMSAIFAAKPLQILDVPTSQTTDIQSLKYQSSRMLCDADSGRDKKRQKFNSKPDEKIGSSNLHLEVKNEDDHVLKLVSTLETIEAHHVYPDAENVQYDKVGVEGTKHIIVEGVQQVDVGLKGIQHIEGAQNVDPDAEDAQHGEVGVEGIQNIDVQGEGTQYVNAEGAQPVDVGVEGEGAQHVGVSVDGEGAKHVDIGIEGAGAHHVNVNVEGKQLVDLEDTLLICQSNLSKEGMERQRLHSDPDYQVGKSKPCLDRNYGNENHGLTNDVQTCCPNSQRKPGYHEIHFPNTKDVNAGNCAFCNSSKVTEGYLPMRYFSNGESKVSKTSKKNSNVLHIHDNCFEWAPRVFIDDDGIVQNLETEIFRASRTKCSMCRKKGASLGCYEKKCLKSYHIPCALKLPNCRWDSVRYHFLCSNHRSSKFSSDRSATENTVIDFKKFSDKPDILLKDLIGIKHVGCSGDVRKVSHNINKDWVLCGSSLSIAEKLLLENFAKLTGSVVLEHWKENVTHVVAATNDLGGCSRTVKFIKAILTGKWILTIEWIKESLKAKHPVSEDPYEITHDIHGVFDGPKTGRIRAMEKALPLFSGLSFYFSSFPQFSPSYKRHLESMIILGGGKIINERDLCNSWLESIIDTQFHTTFVVYNLDNTGRCDLLATEAIANKLSAKVISHIWILDSLAACKI
ncbi:hypothetical protein ZOSMA_215G00380 [Zostera marina]|uniref:RING-type E3 ubiquitin transferase BRCA1 n=1 Tax=Zostera marina TaxID=29655 RepID=A0A0K9PK17_ZOSMR|nr:hypothetical protein ZOSMA_215G00380 [Zostera marina]